MVRTYSTSEAAGKIGISRQTLQAWINRNLIVAPKVEKVGRIEVRLWTDADIKKAQRFKGTLRPGPKPKR